MSQMFFNLNISSKKEEEFDFSQKLIIIGSGPAGLTAGIYASRGQLNPLVIGGKDAGGQLMTTNEVENFPGFPGGTDGPSLISKMREQAELLGTKFLDEDLVDVDFSVRPFKLKTESGKNFESDAVIIATGAKPKEIGLESERRLRGKGVSYCATCDAPFFSGVDAVVYGGGNVALEEALFLSKYANKVMIVYRRGKENLRAEKILQKRAFENPKIEFVFNSVITDVIGTDKVEGVVILDKSTNEKYNVKIGGLLVAIGYIPQTEVFENTGIEMNNGYIIHKKYTMTSIPGVFAAGDVVDDRYRQAITAAAEGCKAAIDVEKWLQNPQEFTF